MRSAEARIFVSDDAEACKASLSNVKFRVGPLQWRSSSVLNERNSTMPGQMVERRGLGAFAAQGIPLAGAFLILFPTWIAFIASTHGAERRRR